MVRVVRGVVCKRKTMNTIKKISSFFHSLIIPHPMRDWLLVLGSGVVIFVILAVVSVNYFLGVRSGNIVGDVDAPTVTPPRISRDELQKTADLLILRRSEYEQGEIPAPDVSDPSL